MSTHDNVLEETVTDFVDSIATAIPDILAALLFLLLAYIAVKIVLSVARSTLRRVYTGQQQLIVDLLVTVLAIVLWFGVALTLLSILGLGEIAASLGTATGFIALGVAYALSEMIEDTVAGVYLLRDPDFNVGDRVSTDAATGTVRAIELRKSRIETDEGDMVIVANRSIESLWTHDLSGGE
jgi:small-conductance mechanosensitive channel